MISRMTTPGAGPSELVERLELQHEVGIFVASLAEGHKVVSYGDAAAEIRRLSGLVEIARLALSAIGGHDMGFAEDRNRAMAALAEMGEG